MNPLLNLKYETAIESLGNEYYDDVQAAEFPQHILRFRNDDLLPRLNLNPQEVKDEDFIEAFGKFQGHSRPFLALCYHGYQFGQYNPGLGDGRGFLYGQVRGVDGGLYDFGTKGSGRTPYSRGGDGMLTLKGGIREVIAAETLYQMGVNTSRCLSLIETGLSLYRGDEPSPTRSSVMIRFNKSHIRFGTFERLHYLGRKDLIEKLLDHVIEYYYSHLLAEQKSDRYALFYAELVERVAKLASQWMTSGFCHAVLNTDNMSITGESFDYGPFAFIPSYDLDFTAAYFDYSGRYSYGNQPGICKLNLELLQKPLGMVISTEDMETAIDRFEDCYLHSYQKLMLAKLGLTGEITPQYYDFLIITLQLLAESQVSYHGFFAWLRSKIEHSWHHDLNLILTDNDILEELSRVGRWNLWRNAYHEIMTNLHGEQLQKAIDNVQEHNLITVPLRSVIESVWEPITEDDNWQPFYDLLAKIKNKS